MLPPGTESAPYLIAFVPSSCRSSETDSGWDVTDYRDGTVGTIIARPGYRHTYGAFHPDGKHFATTAAGRIMMWDEDEKLSLERNVLPGQRITELDYTSDGSRIAASGSPSAAATRPAAWPCSAT